MKKPHISAGRNLYQTQKREGPICQPTLVLQICCNDDDASRVIVLILLNVSITSPYSDCQRKLNITHQLRQNANLPIPCILL